MERVWSTTRRGFSVRSILTFVLTVFITALLWVTFGSHVETHAVDGSAASWKGDSILFSGNQYFSAGDVKAGDSTGLPVGTHYYLYTTDSSASAPKTQKAFVVYFTPGTDPPTAKSATYITYDYSSTKVFSNPAGKLDIVVTPKGAESSYSSCTVQGIGWIVCPVTVFLADSMDNLFNLLKGFFVVAPVNVTSTTNDLHTAWNVMRSIANVAFIIVFLIIIYSQLTNAGVTNYGLKKLLPRLIIAAVLVNVSYFICAIAVDISNIIGYSLQDIFVSIRQNTFNINNNTWADSTGMGWSAVTTFVLSGGAVSAGVLIAAGGSIGAALYLLIPVLVGLVATVLVVLLILAARQAIITILIVIAPLAFVAYLLPNTEQWFKKWRELFMTMLVFFPAFSLVFGGSQLAGGIIIQNATSIVGVIFGLAVQVAPLVITPLLLKLSGGLLGRIAGMVNDPKKGLLDRTKNWSKDRSEMLRQKSLSRTDGRPNPFRSAAQNLDNRGRRVKERTALYTAMNDNRYNSSDWHEKVHEQEYATGLEKQRIDNKLNAHNIRSATVRGSELNIKALELENSKVILETATSTENAMYSEYRSGKAKTGGDARLKALRSSMAAQVMENSVQLQRKQSADSKQVELFAKQMEKNQAMRVTAGGVQGETGAQRALAIAISAQSKAHSEAVSNAASILSHYNYSDALVNDIALGKTTSGIKVKVTNDIIEAAIGQIAGGSNTAEIIRLMQELEINTTPANLDFRQTFSEKLIANPNKPKFAGAGMLGDAKQGINIPAPGKARLDKFIADTINADKLGSADLLVSQDNEYLKAVLDTLKGNSSGVTLGPEKLATIKKSIELARKNPLYAGKIGERKDVLDNIYKEL